MELVHAILSRIGRNGRCRKVTPQRGIPEQLKRRGSWLLNERKTDRASKYGVREEGEGVGHVFSQESGQLNTAARRHPPSLENNPGSWGQEKTHLGRDKCWAPWEVSVLPYGNCLIISQEMIARL